MSPDISFIQRYLDEGKILKTLDEYPKSKEIELYRRCADELGASKNTIKIFDDWVENWMPKQIESQSFNVEKDGIETGERVEFRLHKLTKPMIIKDGREIKVLPKTCRAKNVTYAGILKLKYQRSKVIDGERKTIEDRILSCGSIPIMLGSKYCYLYDKTPEQLLQMGECISDPFGYFLIKSEMSLITQEKARVSIPMIVNGKEGPNCTYTSQHINGTRIIFISTGKKWNTIKIRIPGVVARDKTLPLFLVYKYLLPDQDIEDFEQMILNYAPRKFRLRVKTFLNDSVIKYSNIENIVEYIVNKKPMQKNVEQKSWFKLEYSDEVHDELYKSIQDDILEELFINLKGKDNEAKVKAEELSFIISKYILTIIGVLPFESRDSWALKRFESAGRSMNMLFSGLFEKVVLLSRQDYKSVNYEHFHLDIKKNGKIISKEYKDSFNTEVWSVKAYNYNGRNKRGWTRENISNATDRLTPLSLYSQLDKNNTPTSRQTRSIELREVQPSQRNRHCPAETPEGENNGLNKYQSLLCTFSIEDLPEADEAFEKIIEKQFEKQKGTSVVLFNGKILLADGEIIKVTIDFIKVVKELRRRRIISKFTEVYYDNIMDTIEIYTDGSRPTCPYLIVNQTSKKLMIDEQDGWTKSLEELLNTGCVEFVASREEENEDFLLCTSVEKFRKLSSEGKINGIYNYTHCNIDPNQMFSTSTSVAPMTDRQPGPRNTYQASMGKQAMGSFSLNHHNRFYTTYRVLHRGSRAFTETDTYFIPKMDIMPSGQTINVAFTTDPDNQEDAVVISEDALESGLLSFYKYITIKCEQQEPDEEICWPGVSSSVASSRYANIQQDGFPIINAYINEGDCILGKKTGDTNTSIFTGVGESGYVDRIYKTKVDNSFVIKIKLRKFSKYREGDKEAFRYSQKGTVGRIEKRENLIRVADGPNKGITPDLIFNPHGFPSRQTMGILLEGLITKAALYNGERVNVSAFRKIDVDKARETLMENGMDPDGYEIMEKPDGTKMKNGKIFFVPLYTQALKHHVMDKISIRSSGQRNIYTHQPRGGRTQGGAQKVGEMEKDSFVAHGASGVIVDRMRICSDEFKMAVCNNCGNILHKKEIENRYVCTLCDKSEPGILTVSYVFKLLVNLLVGMGLDVTLNTSIKE